MITRHLISIRNIPWTVSQLELKKHFSAFGEIKNAKVVFNKYGLSTGYGYVEFYDAQAFADALCRIHVLEKEQLHVTAGITYLQHAGLAHFVENYAQENRQRRTEQYTNEQRVRPLTGSKQSGVLLNHASRMYKRKLSADIEPSFVKELLFRNTSR